MDRRKLNITLVGSEQDQGDVELADFRKFCDELSRCLRRVEVKFPESVNSRIRYRIVDLRKGSACLALEPIPTGDAPDFGPDVIDLFSNTVRNLQNGTPLDPRFTNDDLSAFRSLAAPIRGRITEMRIGRTIVTSRFIANIDEIIGTAIPTEGSVKGRLERLNVHDRFEFIIYPPIPGYSIRCIFGDELFDEILGAIRKNVTVYGKLHFRPGRPFPEQVRVSSIEIHPSDDQLPKLADLRGAWKGSTGGLNSIEFVQANRDE